MADGTDNLPAEGEFVLLRGRQWLVEEVRAGHSLTSLRLSCIDDDAQGEVVEVAWPAGVIVVGEKLHDAPEGNPAQLKLIGEENEFCGVTTTVTAPLCPAVTESAPGETVTEKFGVITLNEYAAEPIALAG